VRMVERPVAGQRQSCDRRGAGVIAAVPTIRRHLVATVRETRASRCVQIRPCLDLYVPVRRGNNPDFVDRIHASAESCVPKLSSGGEQLPFTAQHRRAKGKLAACQISLERCPPGATTRISENVGLSPPKQPAPTGCSASATPRVAAVGAARLGLALSHCQLSGKPNCRGPAGTRSWPARRPQHRERRRQRDLLRGPKRGLSAMFPRVAGNRVTIDVDAGSGPPGAVRTEAVTVRRTCQMVEELAQGHD
jgi:hypothetical protein